MIATTALADQLNTTHDDILALVDQLIAIDGTHATVAYETAEKIVLTDDAVATITEQIAGEQS